MLLNLCSSAQTGRTLLPVALCLSEQQHLSSESSHSWTAARPDAALCRLLFHNVNEGVRRRDLRVYYLDSFDYCDFCSYISPALVLVKKDFWLNLRPNDPWKAAEEVLQIWFSPLCLCRLWDSEGVLQSSLTQKIIFQRPIIRLCVGAVPRLTTRDFANLTTTR